MDVISDKTKSKEKSKSKPTKQVPLDHFYDINCSYLHPNEVNDDYIGCQKSDLSIFQGNVRSLNANFDSVSDIFDKCQSLPDILAITETKLKKGDDEPPIGGYVFERTDTTTEFGGVGIYISNDFKYSVRSDLALGVRHCEDIWIDIKTDQSNKSSTYGSKNLVIGVIYRHPGHKYDFYCSQLCDTLNKLNASKTDYVVVGDINIDILKFNLATDVTDYINSLYSVGCNVSINRPTRVAKKSATCIDHIYTSMSQERLSSSIIMSDVSDHYSTLTKISGFPKSSEENNIYSRKSDLNQNEWDRFNIGLKNLLCHELPLESHNHDVNHQANSIAKAYQTMIDKFMPLRKLSAKRKKRISKPWMTTGLMKSSAKKSELFVISKFSKDPKDYEEYKRYLNIFTKMKKNCTQELLQ